MEAELQAAEKPVPPTVEFFAYKIDEKQLQKSAGDDYRLRSDTYFHVIQRYLGLGEVEKAREMIEEWDSMFCDGLYQYRHLTRMRKLLRDPDWPHWIGKKRRL